MTVGAGIFGYTQTAVWLSAVVHEMFTTQSFFSAKKTHLSTQLLRNSSPVINWTWLFFRHTNSLRLRRVQLTVRVWTDSSLVTSHKTGKVSLEARQLSLSALSLWLHSCDFTQTINKLKLKSFSSFTVTRVLTPKPNPGLQHVLVTNTAPGGGGQACHTSNTFCFHHPPPVPKHESSHSDSSRWVSTAVLCVCNKCACHIWYLSWERTGNARFGKPFRQKLLKCKGPLSFLSSSTDIKA